MNRPSLWVIWLALALGNFLYQGFRIEPDFLQAAERTFFQGGALFMVWIWEILSD